MKRLLLVALGILLLFSGCISDTEVQTEGQQEVMYQSAISPGLVEVDNYYPGAIAEHPLEIHNNQDTIAEYVISYRQPNRVKDGFIASDFSQWLKINEPVVIVAPQTTKEVLLSLEIPEGIELDEKHVEFWISVIEQGQGMVQTEMCGKWRVSMR